MEVELKCPACRTLFDVPYQIDCGHVFCAACLQNMQNFSKGQETELQCPVCCKPFQRVSKPEDRDTSVYHEALLKKIGPAARISGKECTVDAEFVCEKKSGPMRSLCFQDHSKSENKQSHIVSPVMEKRLVDMINPGVCIIHGHEIKRLCDENIPAIEMCSECVMEYSEKRPNTQLKHVSKIDYFSTKGHVNLEDALKQTAARMEILKNEAIEKTKKCIDSELAEINKIKDFTKDMKLEIEKLETQLIDMVQQKYQNINPSIEALMNEFEISENLIKYSNEMLQEAEKVHKDTQVVTKLYKSTLFAQKLCETIQIKASKYGSTSTEPTILRSILEFAERSSAQLSEDLNLSKNHVIRLLRQNMDDDRPSSRVLQGYLDKAQYDLKELQQKLKEEQEKVRQLGEILVKETTSASAMNPKPFHHQPTKWISDPKKYKFLAKIGGRGGGRLQFGHPWGITAHPHTGHIYVTEWINHRVQVLTPNLDYVTTFGKHGKNVGEFDTPLGVAISNQGFIAVSEFKGNRVQIFHAENKPLFEIKAGHRKSASCTQATEYDGFEAPIGICFDDSGNLFVANRGKNRVDKFNASFDFECSFSREAEKGSEPRKVQAICFVHSKNLLCVVEFSGKRLILFDTNGQHVQDIAIAGLQGDVSIAEGPAGTIFVSDLKRSTIVAYGLETGQVLYTLHSEGCGDGQFYQQAGICFGPGERLYVCDYWYNHRVQVFSN